jgi:tetratricopeptide (TPR) repeat protein
VSAAFERIGTDRELLEEALSLSRGAAFFFILCDEGSLREWQMQRLREALEAWGRSVRVVRLDPETPHLFSALASLPIDSSSVVFVDVRGIELARLDPANYPEEMGLHQQALNARRALQSLNLQREQLATLGIPLLFWVSAQALGQIAQRAADLFAARSGIFDLRTFWSPEPFPREGLLDIVYLERETRLPVLPRAIQDLPSEELRRRFQLYERRLREEEAKTPPHFPRQASLHQELARIAWALGEITRALEHQEAATALYRKLATEVGEDFLPHLAAGLYNLSEILSALGRRAEALQATQEAVDLYRRLAAQHPDAFLPDLAASLTNLGAMLSALGRRAEALEATQEAVDLYHRLAAQHPDAFLPDLARSLHNLGAMLSALGRRAEALQAAQEAVDLYRRLAAQHPDAFLPDLARSLHNLGAMLSALGRRAEALQAAQEAVEIRRRLAAQHPDAFLPDLAASLNNLGAVLSALGRWEEALEAAREAVALYRRLAAQHPDAFLPDLASSLTNLGSQLSALGRRAEALQATQEAVDLYRRLAAQHPDAFLPDLARSLGAYGLVLRGLGRSAEAAAAFAEGLRTILPFVRALPAAFGGLAGALLQDYLRACAEAEEAPDEALVVQVRRAIG